MKTEKRQPLLSEVSRRRKFALLNERLASGSRVLVVGSGEGWFARRLREHGHVVLALDLVPPADIVGNILEWRTLGLRRSDFDAVVALEVIEHVDCLAEIRTLCKPGGLIMLSSPHPAWDWVMKILEAVRLTQRRTSEHSNLTDFATIDLDRVVFTRPLHIHQVAIFRNGMDEMAAAESHA